MRPSSIQRWLVRPRLRVALHPTYSSWLNLLERWFAELTEKWIKRGAHCSINDLVASIRTLISKLEQEPQAIRVTQGS